jgi:4-amino-4-deoxy-L-arabinose transferase-like glycosyltransferase
MFKDKILNILKNKYNLALLAIVIISACISINYINIDSVWPDEAFYAWAGHKIYQDVTVLSQTEIMRTISYVPFSITVFFNLFLDGFMAAKAMVISFSIIGVIGVYYIGSQLKNKFVGLMAAAFMAFNPLYMFLDTRALTDVPISTMMVLVFICLFEYEKNKNTLWGTLLGVSSVLCFFTKSSGIIIFPVLLFYFVFTRKTKILHEFKNKGFISGVSIIISCMSIFFVYNIIRFGTILPGGPLSAYASSHFFGHGFEYYILSFPDVISWFLLLFFIIGVVFALLNTTIPKFLAIALWFIVGLIIFSIVGEKDARYLLPILPAAFLFVGYGFEKLCINKQVRYLLITVGFILIFVLGSQGVDFVKYKSNSYMGLIEAGDWLKDNAGVDSVIYAGSTRAMRAFSGFEYAEDGGIINVFPSTKEQFESGINSTTKNIFLELDIWEYTQPEWVYPLDEGKARYLDGLGFKPVDIITKTVNGQIGNVVIIMQKI